MLLITLEYFSTYKSSACITVSTVSKSWPLMQSSCPATPFFFVNVRAVFMTQLTSEFLACGITTAFHVYMKSLVIVTFLLSTSSKTAGFPSSTISMVQRTEIRVLVSCILNNLPCFAWAFQDKHWMVYVGLGSVLKRSSQAISHLSDLLF